MKLAAQIFIIIGMVVGFWTILPLVFGIMALVKMKEGKPATWLNLRKKKSAPDINPGRICCFIRLIALLFLSIQPIVNHSDNVF